MIADAASACYTRWKWKCFCCATAVMRWTVRGHGKTSCCVTDGEEGRDASCRGGCTWLFVAGFDGIVVEFDTDSIALSRRLHDRLAGRW